MYTVTNFPTKAALKRAVAAHKAGTGPAVEIYSPGPFPAPTDGRASLEGPHYPKPHTWWASATLSNGVVVSVS